MSRSNNQLPVSITHSITINHNRWINLLLTQSINQSINQSIIQSINQLHTHTHAHTLAHSLTHLLTCSLITHSLSLCGQFGGLIHVAMVMLMSCYITYQLTFRANWTIPARATRRTLIKLNMNNVQYMVGMTTEMRYINVWRCIWTCIHEQSVNYISLKQGRPGWYAKSHFLCLIWRLKY